MLKLGLIQMRCSINPLENVDKAETMIRHAASKGANIVCLQEIFSTIYFCQSEDHGYFRFAEGIPGPTTVRLGRDRQGTWRGRDRAHIRKTRGGALP